MLDAKWMLACAVVLFVVGFFVSRYQCRRGNYDEMRSWVGWGLIIGVVFIAVKWLIRKHEIDELLMAVGVGWAAVLGMYLGSLGLPAKDHDVESDNGD